MGRFHPARFRAPRFMPARFGGAPGSSGPVGSPEPEPVLITGSAPALGELVDGDALGTVVVWGAYTSPRGPIESERQMQRDGGAWMPFDAQATVHADEVWTLREVVSDGTSVLEFTSAPVAVLARPVVPAIFGGEGEIVIAVPPDVLAPAVTGGTGALIIGA